MKFCKNCDKPLKGKQRLYCSKQCGSQGYYKEHKEDYKKYWEIHKEQRAVNSREWRKRHPLESRAQVKKYRDTHKDQWNAYLLEYYHSHKEKYHLKNKIKRFIKYFYCGGELPKKVLNRTKSNVT